MTLQQATAFAPGSIGNVGPGLDILGLAVANLGDLVTVRRREGRAILMEDAGHPELPTDPARHSCGLAAAAVLRRAGADATGLGIALEKHLPLSGGQGGSAASAVAAAVATNAVLGGPLDSHALIASALEAEAAVAGRHADNIAPSLLGGCVLVRTLDPLDVTRLPVPEGLTVVLAHPAMRLATREGRAVLPRTLTLPEVLAQAANIAALTAAFCLGDLALLGRALDDRIAEPARAPLLPGFAAAKAAALGAGALGASISGSGPTAFALARDLASGEAIATAMQAAYAQAGLPCATRVAPVDHAGARIEAAS